MESLSKNKYKKWWIFFIISQILILSLIIGSLASTSWVYSINSLTATNSSSGSPTNTNFNGAIFQGSLSFCYSGCYGSYIMLHDQWCSASNSELSDNSIRSVCLMFTNLMIGMFIIVLIDLSAILGLILWCSTIICCLDNKKFFKLTFIFSAWVLISHFTAIFSYYGLIKTEFIHCDRDPKGDMPKLCLGHGARASSILILIIPIVILMYFVIAYRYLMFKQEEEKHENQARVSINEVPEVVIVPTKTKGLYFSEVEEDGGPPAVVALMHEEEIEGK